MTETMIAHHEAAHAVVAYRLTGFSSGAVTIIPRLTEDGIVQGAMEDGGCSESFSPADMEAYILSCYAGGHAQRELDAGDTGCTQDDSAAAALLAQFSWEAREQELRDRSLQLTRQHWPEIVAVAEDLVRIRVLHADEIAIIADYAAGDPEADIDLYRRRFADVLESWRRAQGAE